MLPAAHSNALEDGRNYCPKHVELIEIINKPLLLHLGGYLYYCIRDARPHKHQTDKGCATLTASYKFHIHYPTQDL